MKVNLINDKARRVSQAILALSLFITPHEPFKSAQYAPFLAYVGNAVNGESTEIKSMGR
jgi:hypothetical protein